MKDDGDLGQALRNSGQPAPVRQRAVDDSRPRIEASRGDSSIGAASRLQIPASFLGEPIEPSGGYIGLELPVPLHGIKFRKASAENRAIMGRELPDCLFDFFNCAHDMKYTFFRTRT
jgi:hypothetical protein